MCDVRSSRWTCRIHEVDLLEVTQGYIGVHKTSDHYGLVQACRIQNHIDRLVACHPLVAPLSSHWQVPVVCSSRPARAECRRTDPVRVSGSSERDPVVRSCLVGLWLGRIASAEGWKAGRVCV